MTYISNAYVATQQRIEQLEEELVEVRRRARVWEDRARRNYHEAEQWRENYEALLERISRKLERKETGE